MQEDLAQTTDQQLMIFYQQGQVLAFEELYKRYSSRVFRYLAQKTRSSRLAEDLTQEVFLKFHRSKHLYDSALPVGPWVFSITKSVFLDAVKKKNLEVLTDPADFESIPEDRSPADAMPETGAPSELLQGLSASQQQAVRLRVMEEASFEEIANRLSTTPENARQLFSRGLKVLRKRIAGRD